MNKFSVLVLTYNEEISLNVLLKNISNFTDDIVILDSFSTDDTLKVAKKYGCKVFQREFDNEKNQRTYGLSLPFKYEWVFNPDADEIPDKLFVREMLEVLENNPKEVAYEVRFKNYYKNKWLRFSTDYPVYVIRYFKPNRLSFEREINLKYCINGKIGKFQGHFNHYPFVKGLSWWISKHNNYSTKEAEEMFEVRNNRRFFSLIIELIKEPNRKNRRIVLKEISFFLPLRGIVRFFYTYILKLGFLDGIQGLRYAVLISIYEFFIFLKYLEKK